MEIKGTLDMDDMTLTWDDVETLPDLVAALTPAELARLWAEEPVALARLMEVELG